MRATLYDNGLYYVMKYEVRKYFKSDPHIEKVLKIQRAEIGETPQQKKTEKENKLCTVTRKSKILDEPDWFKARRLKERIITFTRTASS